MEKNKKQQTNDADQHIQIVGLAYYEDNGSFFFAPDSTVPDQMKSFRRRGTAQQMSDGTFDFVPESKIRSRSKLIKKLAHGRLSETQDGYIQLTLRFKIKDNEDIAEGLLAEAVTAFSVLSSVNR